MKHLHYIYTNPPNVFDVGTTMYKNYAGQTIKADKYLKTTSEAGLSYYVFIFAHQVTIQKYYQHSSEESLLFYPLNDDSY